MEHVNRGTVAVLLKGYPRLSETFIAEEIRALERRGVAIRIVSLRQPTDRERHPVHREIRAPIHYLPEYLHEEPRRVWQAWRTARTLPGFRSARRTWLRDLLRQPTRNRVRRFGQAMVLASELPEGVAHLHAHFLHTPASVARYTSLMTGRPWSCSAHARDIWTSPVWELREKLAACRWAVTCTAHNAEYLNRLASAGRGVEVVYHGIDLNRLSASTPRWTSRDGSDPVDPVIVLSVGRAVEKKGYDDLLAALARLPARLHWRFVHIGGGPLKDALQRRASRHGIADRVSWLGAKAREEVLAWYGRADLFALASRIAADGDRDGLPNVLLEAQALGLPCVSTRLSAIPELIRDGESGLLVAERDTDGLAAALARLMTHPVLRRRLGAAGQREVIERFSFGEGIERLMRHFAMHLEEKNRGLSPIS